MSGDHPGTLSNWKYVPVSAGRWRTYGRLTQTKNSREKEGFCRRTCPPVPAAAGRGWEWGPVYLHRGVPGAPTPFHQGMDPANGSASRAQPKSNRLGSGSKQP